MDIGTIIKEMLTPELMPLVVVLYLIGIGLKNTGFLDNKYIPLVLGIISIVANALYVLSTTVIETQQDTFAAILTVFMQGILFAGASVYINQIYQQMTKSNE